MNILSPFTRTCVQPSLPFRSIPATTVKATQARLRQRTQIQRQAQIPNQIQRPNQQRQTSTSTQLNAQPIDLTSSTTPASPSEPSTLTSTILSRAPTDPSTATTTTIRTSPTRAKKTQSSTPSPFLLLGTITRTGTMTSTVQVTLPIQRLNRQLQKHYTQPSRLLAHDPFPATYLREGDVVEFGLFNAQEKADKEQKRLELQDKLVEKGVIRLKTRKGKERDLKEVGVKRRGPRWVVRRVVTPFGVPVEKR